MRDILHNLQYFKYSYPSPSVQLFSLPNDISERLCDKRYVFTGDQCL